MSKKEEAIMARPPYMGADRAAALVDDEEVEKTPEELEEEKLQEELNKDSDDDLDAEEKTYKKRYGDLRRHLNDTKKQVKEKDEEYQRQIALLKEEMDALKKGHLDDATDQQVKEFREQFPDAYKILETVASQRNKEAENRLKELEEKLHKTERESSETKAEAVLTRRHHDWQDIREDEAFHEWVETKSKRIQDGIYENTTDGDWAADIIDMYKAERGVKKSSKSKERDEMKRAAARVADVGGGTKSPHTKDKPTFKESEIEAMPIHEYERKEAEIMEAYEDGRILIGE